MSALAPAHRPIVVPPRSAPGSLGRARQLLLVLIALVMVAPPLYLSQTGGALATGYSIQKLQAERRQWQMRNRQLELELAKARSLAWIEAEAVQRLGMQRPSQPTVVRIDRPIPAGPGRPHAEPAEAVAVAAGDGDRGDRWGWLESLAQDLLDRAVGR